MICFDSWEKAQQDGTDNEMYGALLSDHANPARVYGNIPTNPPDWHLGCDLPSVKFCPWCGANKP